MMPQRPTVLIVEDDPDLMRFAQLTLRLGGYRVLSAVDGEAALDLVRKRQPALVVLDLRLPVLDGWQVLEIVTHDAGLHTIPVLIVTASVDGLSKPKALAMGAADCLLKPVSADALLDAVGRILAEQGSDDTRR
jgi:CheY-like chemotaxis protein